MASVLTIAVLLFAFGFIAQEVARGKTLTFDRQVILALRSSTDPSIPIGPAWLPEAARDITSLGSILVLGIITLAVAGYLFLLRKHASGLGLTFEVDRYFSTIHGITASRGDNLVSVPLCYWINARPIKTAKLVGTDLLN
jgi:hypothetical protein